MTSANRIAQKVWLLINSIRWQSMDLQDFESQQLYFDKPNSEQVDGWILEASKVYAEGKAEPLLLKAFAREPENLSVLVALYRFYYYQHRLEDAIEIAYRAMAVTAPMIAFPEDWSELKQDHLAMGVMRSFTMVRFYLLALKGCAYLHLRLNRIETGVKMLNKVIAMDSKDRLGARALLLAMGPASISEVSTNSQQTASASR